MMKLLVVTLLLVAAAGSAAARALASSDDAGMPATCSVQAFKDTVIAALPNHERFTVKAIGARKGDDDTVSARGGKLLVGCADAKAVGAKMPRAVACLSDGTWAPLEHLPDCTTQATPSQLVSNGWKASCAGRPTGTALAFEEAEKTCYDEYYDEYYPCYFEPDYEARKYQVFGSGPWTWGKFYHDYLSDYGVAARLDGGGEAFNFLVTAYGGAAALTVPACVARANQGKSELRFSILLRNLNVLYPDWYGPPATSTTPCDDFISCQKMAVHVFDGRYANELLNEQSLFFSPECGERCLGTVLSSTDAAKLPQMQWVSMSVDLTQYKGKNIIIAFRVASTDYILTNFDSIQVVTV